MQHERVPGRAGRRRVAHRHAGDAARLGGDRSRILGTARQLDHDAQRAGRVGDAFARATRAGGRSAAGQDARGRGGRDTARRRRQDHGIEFRTRRVRRQCDAYQGLPVQARPNAKYRTAPPCPRRPGRATVRWSAGTTEQRQPVRVASRWSNEGGSGRRTRRARWRFWRAKKCQRCGGCSSLQAHSAARRDRESIAKRDCRDCRDEHQHQDPGRRPQRRRCSVPRRARARRSTPTWCRRRRSRRSITVPRQECVNGEQLVQQQPSGAGAVVGAIAGGVIGNQFGHGFGRAAATGLGAVAGSAIGNNVEANANPPTAVPVQRCRTVNALREPDRRLRRRLRVPRPALYDAPAGRSGPAPRDRLSPDRRRAARSRRRRRRATAPSRRPAAAPRPPAELRRRAAGVLRRRRRSSLDPAPATTHRRRLLRGALPRAGHLSRAGTTRRARLLGRADDQLRHRLRLPPRLARGIAAGAEPHSQP